MNKKFQKNRFFVLLSFFIIAATLQIFAQWERITTIPKNLDDTTFLDVFFLESDPDYGWVCGYQGTVIRTTDGGETWQGLEIPYMDQLESIFFVNKRIGYTSGSNSSLGLPDRIFKSTDGGASWDDITPDFYSYGFDKYQFNLWGNYFLNENYGVVVGGGCAAKQGNGYYQQFWRTTDGGASWSVFKTDLPNTGMTDVILYPGGSGYAVSSGYIWTTADSGKTWEIFVKSGENDWQEEITHIGNSFLVPFAGGCMGHNDHGGMRMTTDNGNNWREYITGNRMFGAFLLDEKTGWAIGENQAVYLTTDGGVTWSKINCGLTVEKHTDDIWFIDDTTGFIAGTGVYRYQNLPDTISPTISAIGDTVICRGEELTLFPDEDYPYILWSTNDTTRSITVSEPGEYWVRAGIDSCNWNFSNKIRMSFHKRPENILSISSPNPLCVGDTVEFNINYENFEIVNWSTGDTTGKIEVTESGVYEVTVIDTNGCTWTESREVNFLPNPKPELTVTGRKDPCLGDSVMITAHVQTQSFSWHYFPIDDIQSGGKPKDLKDSSLTIVVKESGRYFIRVTNSNGCTNESDTVEVRFRNDTNDLIISFDKEGRGYYFDETVYPSIVCGPVKISNRSDYPVNINDVFIKHNIAFSLPQSQFPIILPPKGQISLEVCFTPRKEGVQYDTLMIGDTCWLHSVPVEGIGIAEDYYGTTRCETPIRLKTIIDGDYSFAIADPYPNPAENIIKVPFSRTLPNSMPPEQTVTLTNTLGSKVTNGKEKILNENTNSETITQTGEFEINVSDVSSGFYIIKVKTSGKSYAFPIIVD